MADEVTKKDLQSLQGYVNKQLKDLEGRIDKRLEKAEGMISALKEVPTAQDMVLAKIIQDTRSQLEKLIFGLKVDVDALKGEVAAIKKAVAE